MFQKDVHAIQALWDHQLQKLEDRLYALQDREGRLEVRLKATDEQAEEAYFHLTECHNLLQEQTKKTEERVERLDQRLKAMEEVGSPSFERAKAAAQAVDEFNSGITAILNFDPHEVLKAQREDHTGGERS
jgi:chromosome segregation ATPase